MRCHARLMRYDSQYKIGTRLAFKVSLCTSPANGILCEGCAKRPTDRGKHEPRIHGLLSEPIPADSHIYGGSWYWRQVEKFGEPSAEWLAEAKAAQAAGEEWIEGAWKVEEVAARDKPDESTEDREMASASTSQKEQKQKTQKTQKKTQKPASEVLPLTKLFPAKVTPLYKEVSKSVVTMSTDYRTIVKGLHNGTPVWVLPNGKMMHMDEQGEPRGFI